MIDVDGMVGRLMQLMEDAHTASCLGSSREDGITEMLLRDHLATAEREEDAAALDALEPLEIQARITLQGVVKSAAMLGKGRRVEHDEVVLILVGIEEFEGIVAESLMAGIIREVQRHVLIGELDGLRATVDGMHQPGTTPHGIDRKATGIAEHVQHATSLRVLLKQMAILTLVDKEARLLAMQPVYTELQSIL